MRKVVLIVVLFLAFGGPSRSQKEKQPAPIKLSQAHSAEIQRAASLADSAKQAEESAWREVQSMKLGDCSTVLAAVARAQLSTERKATAEASVFLTLERHRAAYNCPTCLYADSYSTLVKP